jgi:cytochrome P450
MSATTISEESQESTLPLDLLDPLAVDDPHAYFRGRRGLGPVQWSERHRAWIVIGHEANSAAFHEPAFSTERMDAFRSRLSGTRADALARAVDLLDGWMLFHEPPKHTQLRAPLSRAFTPRAVSVLRAAIEAEVTRLLDAMEARLQQGEVVDLVEAFSHRLPAAVIARLFGVPEEFDDWLAEWSERFGVVVFGATKRPDYEDVARASGEEFFARMGAFLDDRRAHPTGDLVSVLLAAEDPTGVDGLTTIEIIGACSLILFAGHDTTASLLGSATVALLQPEHRGALDTLRSNTLDADGLSLAIEELLRFEAPAKAMMRQAVADVSFFGAEVRAGDAIFLTLLAANRDPEVFDNPDEIILDRSPNPHVTFGFGRHFCLGASLARLEASLALPALYRRFPNLRLAAAPTWRPTVSDRSPAHIPVAIS